MNEKINIRLPTEWEPQSAVMLTWPHEKTDWAPILDEVISCFVHIAKEILKREKLIIVCPSIETVKSQLLAKCCLIVQIYVSLHCETNNYNIRELF
ncbi:hypothetical protein AGMMS49525_16540 [Bacteroidia bacterium]|nr:hypothetical protein AGMMS49525_16540 [Bacteroidia bacterium]